LRGPWAGSGATLNHANATDRSRGRLDFLKLCINALLEQIERFDLN
jgi:hypothetical protein